MTKPGVPLKFLKESVFLHEDEDACLTWPYACTQAGYAMIWYKKIRRTVSRLVCRRIYGKPPTPRHHACHSCGKGHEGCVNPHHLYWGTPKQNSEEMVRHGTSVKGERSGHAKLDERTVKKIIKMLSQGFGTKFIARKFNISRQNIYCIRVGKTWTHIKRM